MRRSSSARFPALVAALMLVGSSAPVAHATEKTACLVEHPTLINQRPAAHESLGLSHAWRLSRGAVTVAVVDSGVAAANVHFDGGAVLPGLDLVGDSDARRDDDGHGTAIAGQIAARQVSGSGVEGLAPESVILPVRVFSRDSATNVEPDPQRTAEGIVWAARQGAKIIVVAQSTPEDVAELRTAVAKATAAGALVVSSAGNRQPDEPTGPRYPAAYPEVLSVTAVDHNGIASSAVLSGEHIDVAAPGAQVLTTFFDSGDCLLAGDQPASSFATGYAAGVAALVAARHPH